MKTLLPEAMIAVWAPFASLLTTTIDRSSPCATTLASCSSGSEVLITLAARFGRMSWKYQGMAYAAILKHVGVMYQQLYLVATALGLAPCAIGAGNSDRFAAAAGTHYYEETSVGEFVLSGQPVEYTTP